VVEADKRMPTRSLDLVIRTSDPGQKVQVRTVADKLSRLQTALLHIGDYLTGSDFRARGGSTELVRRKCTLFVSNVSIGSFSATLELEPAPSVTSGELGLGEEAVAKLQEIVSLVESEQEIESRVDLSVTNPRHRTRIIKDLTDLWPEERDRLAVEVSFPGEVAAPLTPTGRLVLEGLLSRQRDAEQISVKGVLGTAHVTPGEAFFRITGPDGRITCRITKEQQESAGRLLGKPTIVYGQAEFDSAGNVREITAVDRFEPFRELTLQRLFKGDTELVLRQPVSVAIDYNDDLWIAENDDLGIVAANEDYDVCLQDFQDEFFFAWEEYGRAEDSQLTVGARNLKRSLTELVLGEAR
jgi:hypothetical protein